MAKVEFICQRLGVSDSAEKIKECLSLSKIKEATICVAFARYDGVHTLIDSMKSIGQKMKVIVGINNGITSAQALAYILSTNAKLYVVNTANSVTFHPKTYYALNSVEAKVILGSANLTNSGLNSNIEFSTYSTFLLADSNDKASFKCLNDSVSSLLTKYNQNVFQVSDDSKIQELLDNELIEDERIVRLAKATTKNNSATVAKQSAMLAPKFHSSSHTNPIFEKFTSSRPTKLKQKSNSKSLSTPSTYDDYKLIWESNGLAERDLNIPTGKKTNPTGSMGLKKGNWDIDQRSYFRSKAFNKLAWKKFISRSKSEQEETSADFDIRIQGVDRGIFNLKITHDPRTDTPSYKQNNMMTHLHWGKAKSIIADKNLLGSYMRLYIGVNNPKNFLIEII